MSDRVVEVKSTPACILALAGAIGVGVMLGGLWLAPQPASATPAYASQTGLACGRCHVSAAGGGPRTAFGNAFAANGHKVPGAKGKQESGAKPKGAKPSEPAPAAVTVDTAAPPGCGYYSALCNPTYGYQPQFGYSNALMFRIYPQGR
jgi:hypothetical protein